MAIYLFSLYFSINFDIPPVFDRLGIYGWYLYLKEEI